jgi:hypothetical protein
MEILMTFIGIVALELIAAFALLDHRQARAGKDGHTRLT